MSTGSKKGFKKNHGGEKIDMNASMHVIYCDELILSG